MQASIETEHTRAAREVTAEALRNIEESLARLDQSTPDGAFIARTLRAEMKIVPALLEWLANEREMASSHVDVYVAGVACLSNALCTLIGCTVPPTARKAVIGKTLKVQREHMIEKLLNGRPVASREYQRPEGRA